jgi:hypothetical protein
MTIEQYLNRGPATSTQIQAATGMSQAGVSRRIRAMGNRIIRVQIGRSPHYMMTRDAFGGGDCIPLWCVDPQGNNTAIGNLRPLVHGGFFLQPLPGLPPVLLGDAGNGLFPSLPYFLYDLAPQGFIGRQVAATMAEQANFPGDPKLWTVDHIGQFLVSNGDDLPGNLKLGSQAHLRIRRKPVPYAPDDYPTLADNAMEGEVPGSSAGGEQPKFTAYSGELSSHVIVKFSPRGTDAVATRWRDLLVTEHHAAEALHAVNFPASETRLIEHGGRLFLESKRFDRTGEYGRLSMISLQSADAEFSGTGHGWHHAMKQLYERKLVSWQHLYDTAVLWFFGRLIHNTDMHHGNLSLGIDGDVFRLLPVYDMCSMGFAPKGGEVSAFNFLCPELEELTFVNRDTADEIKGIAAGMARDFWNRVSRDPRISAEFRAFLSRGNPVDLYHERNSAQADLL